MPSALLLDLGLSEEASGPIDRWLSLLRTWNARIDLTAAKDDRELTDLMVADAALLARPEHVGEGARVVDVGTGAGAPGLALALLRPDLRVTLVEPLAKRAAFLRTVLGTLGRTDIVLVPRKGEEVARGEERWDVAISRATLAPAAWVPLGLGLATTAWALLAREDPPEAPGATIEVDVAYDWPLTAKRRRAVRYRKTASGG